jgi:hypothetical protein
VQDNGAKYEKKREKVLKRETLYKLPILPSPLRKASMHLYTKTMR